jgi:hypothetical protein
LAVRIAKHGDVAVFGLGMIAGLFYLMALLMA